MISLRSLLLAGIFLSGMTFAESAYAPFAVTFPYAGATLAVGEPVTITWTGGDPDWTDVWVTLIELTPGYPYAAVAVALRADLNSYAVKWTIPAQIDYGSAHYQTTGHTYQFSVYKGDYTFYAYGPRFTVGPSRSGCACP